MGIDLLEFRSVRSASQHNQKIVPDLTFKITSIFNL